MTKARLFRPHVGHCGYVNAGGLKLFRWVKERHAIQFHDGDCRRALRRGTPVVEVGLRELCELLTGEPEIFYDSEEGA